jgi:hypothetical protein
MNIPSEKEVPIAAPGTPVGRDPEIAFSAEDFAEVQGVAMREAKQGNIHALTIVDRIWRRRTVILDLPPVDDASGLAAAQVTVIAAAAAGRITPREGVAYAAMLNYRRRALDTVEFETRLREIEKANEERKTPDAERQDEDWWRSHAR